MAVEIINQIAEFDLLPNIENLMKSAISTTLKHLDFTDDWEMTLSLVDEKTIKELNRDYRNKDAVTDVLSFTQYTDEGFEVWEDEPVFLGDMVICVARAEQQAEKYGHSLERELAYLTCHSTLHLMGYDHETVDDKKEMRQLEKSIIREMGLQIQTEEA